MIRPFWNRLQNSLLLRLSGMVIAITILAVVSMSVSWMVAETTQGSGKAINVAGSLRMQSWRMASIHQRLMYEPSPQLQRELRQAMAKFEADLSSGSVLSVLPQDETTPLKQAYRQVEAEWHAQVKPALGDLQAVMPEPAAETKVFKRISDFVSRVNELVNQIEEATEAKILVMRVILGVSVIGTILVVGLSVYLIHNILVRPLRDLLGMTDQIGQGNLTARTEVTGEDEIGRLGQAFNLMAEDLSKLYQNLEARVEEKTAELTIANRSLELLYHSIARLYSGPVVPETYSVLLKDLESVLGVGHGIACLVEAEGSGGQIIASTLDPGGGDIGICGLTSCAECMANRGLTVRNLAEGIQVFSVPLQDTESHYGVLQLRIPPGRALEAWQRQLLEALSRHIGIAIGTARRSEQSRRLSLLEERAAIARELHDSLAQSLAYMKIQVSRLKPYLGQGSKEGAEVLNELREGLNSAYRQLRELLTTFRLRIEGEGLNAALQTTVAEFSARGSIPIALDIQIAGCQLSANEEIHTLQIVREALSNVLNHAQATHATVRMACDAQGGVEVGIEDDGVGIHAVAGAHHYGLTIMEERAKNLGGVLSVGNRLPSGTRVGLRFMPAALRGRAVSSESGLAT